jgi:hypothetical protein
VRGMNATKCIAVFAIALLALTPLLGHAAERGAEREGADEGATERGGEREGVKESADEVDTQFIFGFTMGADVGELGEKEIESETVSRSRKSTGSYAALESQLRAEFTPNERIRIEFGVPFTYHGVSGVAGLDDRQRGAFNGFDFELRYRLLDRAHAPIALTFGAEPHWARVDDISGEAVANYGSEFSLAADRELIKDRVFAAINLLYDPEVTLSRTTGLWQHQSTFGFTAAVANQLKPGTFLGAEMRYLRDYDGLGLNAFAGEALFVGPTFYVNVTKQFAVSGSWTVQVAGHATGIPGALDLQNFERYQAKLRLMYTF